MLITNLNAPRFRVEYDEASNEHLIYDGTLVKGRFAEGQREIADRYAAELEKLEIKKQADGQPTA